MSGKFASVVRLIVCSIAIDYCGLGEAHSQGTNEDVVGPLKTMFLNAASWRQYDCLIRMERIEDRAKSAITSRSHIRFVTDWDARKTLCLIDTDGAQFADGKEVKRVKTLAGIVSDGKSVFSFNFPKKPALGKWSLRYFLKDFGVVDLRNVGLTDFPYEFREENDSASFEGMSVLNPLPTGQVKPLGDKLLMRVVTKVQNQDLDVIENYVIDSKAMVTEEWKRTMRIPSGEAGKLYPNMWQEIKWKEIEGCYVPTELVVNKDVYSAEEKKPIARPLFVSIHWFSLNEPLEDKLFDTNILSDLQQVRELVDPVKSGASTLIDRK